MLSKIKQEVEKRVNSSEKEIIVGLYRKLVNSHNEFCDCNYCNVLRLYVEKKKYLAYLKRKMNDPEYDYFNNPFDENNLRFIEITKGEVKNLKREKDKLKEF